MVKVEDPSFDFSQALSQVKIYVPLLEMMRIKEYRDSAIQLISSGNEKSMSYENQMATKMVNKQEKVIVPEVCLNDVLVSSPQVEPFSPHCL